MKFNIDKYGLTNADNFKSGLDHKPKNGGLSTTKFSGQSKKVKR